MTQQDRTVVMIVLAVAVAAASWFLLIKPERQKAADIATQVQTAQASLDQASVKAAAASAARTQYARDYATVVRLGKAVPADDDIASLVYQLDTSANETGVDFQAVTVTDAPSAPEEQTAGGPAGEGGAPASGEGATLPGAVTKLPLTLTFSGGYFQMTRFLRKIERYTLAGREDIDVRGRLVSIEGITLTPGPRGLSDIKAEVTATAYRAPVTKVESDAGSTASSAPAGIGTVAEATTASNTSAPPAPTAVVRAAK